MYPALDNIASIVKVSHAFCLAMHPGHIFFVLLEAIALGQDPVRDWVVKGAQYAPFRDNCRTEDESAPLATEELIGTHESW